MTKDPTSNESAPAEATAAEATGGNQRMTGNENRLAGLLGLAILSLIWGSSFILIKKGLSVFAPYQVGALRLSITALAFLPFFIYHFRQINWRRWPFLLIVGLGGTGIPSFLFPLAQQGISSSLAGILNTLSPLFTFLLGIAIFKSRFTWARLGGVLLGLAGAALLVLHVNGSGVEGSAGYALLAVAATICYAISSNTVGTYLKDTSSLIISAASFVMIGAPAALFLLAGTDFITVLTTHPDGWLGLGYIATLALLSTVLGSLIFFQLIHWTGALFGSTVAYIMPLVSVGWGLLDGEEITVYHVIGMALILTGVYLSKR